MNNNTYPHFTFSGVQDLSTRVPAPAPLVQPQHFPLFFIRSPIGDDEDLINIPTYNDAVRLLGLDTFDQRKPYYNHQTLALEVALGSGNACFVKRITSTGTPAAPSPLKKATAVILMSIDTTTPVYEYERDDRGGVIYNSTTNAIAYALDASGNKIPVPGGVTVKMTVEPLGNMTLQELNSVLITPGSTVRTFPIGLAEASFNGVRSNAFGFKLWAATPNAPYPGNADVVADQTALIYNAQIIVNDGTSTPGIVPALFGDPLTTLMFKPNAYNTYNSQDLTIQNLVTLWTNKGLKAGTAPVHGPIGKFTIFQENLETALGILMAAETANNPVPPESIWMLDFLTATTNDGTMAYGYQMDTSGAMFTANSSFYLSGGTDGSITDKDYEDAVVNFTLTPDTEKCQATNILKYPFSYIYDTGFGNKVKDTLPMWMGYRKNTTVHESVFIAGRPALSHAEEISAASVIQQKMLNQAESNIYSTAAYRGCLQLQSGKLSMGYKHEVSMIFEILIKRCKYMGAGNGIMSTNAADDYTLPPNNEIQYFDEISTPNYTVDSSKEAWNKGAIYSVACGMGERYFYPFIHTIYPNGTSVLTSDVVRHICAHVAWIQAMTWVRLTGRDDLTSDALFIAESNRIFKLLSDGIFSNKVTLTPTTYFTPSNTANGNEWTQSVQVSAQTTKDVATFEVVTVRNK
jgi:hypothetical protein